MATSGDPAWSLRRRPARKSFPPDYERSTREKTDLTNGRLKTFPLCEPEAFESHERMTDSEEVA